MCAREDTYSDRKDRMKAPAAPVLFAVNLAAGWLAGLAIPFELPLSFAARMASGWACLALAAAIGFLALREMRKANTSSEPNSAPRALVTTGPFRFSRNPLYIANVTVSVGIALMLGNGWMLIGTAALAAAIDRLIIPVEERVLAGSFPDEYAAYTRSVRRWI